MRIEKRNEFTFYNADNMAVMAQYPDNYFDLAVVDPPFGINITKSGRLKKYNTKNTTWDNAIPNEDYFEELFRISKNQIIWGGNYFLDFLGATKCFLIYDKKQPQEISFASCEFAWTSFDSVAKTFYFSPMSMKNRIHSCEKPTDLYDWIFKNYSKPNQKIIDTHLGSGSIALAIHKANQLDKMNLEFVGVELDSEYFEAALKRFDFETRQGTLNF